MELVLLLAPSCWALSTTSTPMPTFRVPRLLPAGPLPTLIQSMISNCDRSSQDHPSQCASVRGPCVGSSTSPRASIHSDHAQESPGWARNLPPKASMLAFYLSIFPSRNFKILTHGLTSFCAAYPCSMLPAAMFQHWPITHMWKYHIHENDP